MKLSPQSPLHPQHRTLSATSDMSALCQIRTWAAKKKRGAHAISLALHKPSIRCADLWSQSRDRGVHVQRAGAVEESERS